MERLKELIINELEIIQKEGGTTAPFDKSTDVDQMMDDVMEGPKMQLDFFLRIL